MLEMITTEYLEDPKMLQEKCKYILFIVLNSINS